MCQWQCGAQGPEWQRSLCVLSYVCLCVCVCACYRNMWGPLQCGTQEEPTYCLFTTLRSLSVICIQPWVPKQHDFFFSDLPSDSRTCFKRPLILLCFRTEMLDVSATDWELEDQEHLLCVADTVLSWVFYGKKEWYRKWPWNVLRNGLHLKKSKTTMSFKCGQWTTTIQITYRWPLPLVPAAKPQLVRTLFHISSDKNLNSKESSACVAAVSLLGRNIEG